MTEMIVYDVQTQQQEIVEYDEPIIDEPIKQEPTLEEKLQEVQNDILNMQSVLINQKISGGV